MVQEVGASNNVNQPSSQPGKEKWVENSYEKKLPDWSGVREEFKNHFLNSLTGLAFMDALNLMAETPWANCQLRAKSGLIAHGSTTILHMAVWSIKNCKEAYSEEALEKIFSLPGLDINQKNSRRQPAIMIFAECEDLCERDPEFLKKFLENGADPLQTVQSGYSGETTPFLTAIKNNNKPFFNAVMGQLSTAIKNKNEPFIKAVFEQVLANVSGK